MPVAIVAAGAALATGVMGHLANMRAQDRAEFIQNQNVQEWLKLNIPDPNKQKLALEKFVSSGELIPELEEPIMAAESEFKKIQMDPRLKDARMRSLAALEEQGYGGEQVQDAAAREKAIIESGAANRGRQQAIVSDLERRGQLGSGLELAARMDAAQAEGDRLSSNALQMESDRRMRALNAITGAGDLAGNIQRDDYAMKSDAAKASDAINLFNTQNRQGVLNRNVDRGNTAQQYNLDRAQRINDQNTALSNYEQQYNKELLQKEFENKAAKTAGLTGQYNQSANQALASGQNAAQMWGNVASGVGTAALGAGRYFDNNKKAGGTPTATTTAENDYDEMELGDLYA